MRLLEHGLVCKKRVGEVKLLYLEKLYGLNFQVVVD